MTSVGGAHGGAETERVAHFANHDDVWILPQNVLERVMKRERVQANLALFDNALVVFKNIFDGIFERDDVFFEAGIDVLDHRGQSCRFATTRRAGHQHNAAGRLSDFSDLLEEAELLKAWHDRLDVTHRQAPLAALLKEICAEAANPRNEIRKICFSLLVDA